MRGNDETVRCKEGDHGGLEDPAAAGLLLLSVYVLMDLEPGLTGLLDRPLLQLPDQEGWTPKFKV